MDKIIIQFYRLLPNDLVEQITWYKKADGTKYRTKDPVKLGTKGIQSLKLSMHQEVIVNS